MFAQRLIAARKDAGIGSQAEAARAAGVSKSALSRWESGKARPSLDALSVLLRSYACTPAQRSLILDALMMLTDEMTKKKINAD